MKFLTLINAILVDEGRIYIFLGGLSFPRGNITQDCDDFFDAPCLKENVNIVIFYVTMYKTKISLRLTSY